MLYELPYIVQIFSSLTVSPLTVSPLPLSVYTATITAVPTPTLSLSPRTSHLPYLTRPDRFDVGVGLLYRIWALARRCYPSCHNSSTLATTHNFFFLFVTLSSSPSVVTFYDTPKPPSPLSSISVQMSTSHRITRPRTLIQHNLTTKFFQMSMLSLRVAPVLKWVVGPVLLVHVPHTQYTVHTIIHEVPLYTDWVTRGVGEFDHVHASGCVLKA